MADLVGLAYSKVVFGHRTLVLANSVVEPRPVVSRTNNPPPYPFPVSLAFGQGLHCMVALDPSSGAVSAPDRLS